MLHELKVAPPALAWNGAFTAVRNTRSPFVPVYERSAMAAVGACSMRTRVCSCARCTVRAAPIPSDSSASSPTERMIIAISTSISEKPASPRDAGSVDTVHPSYAGDGEAVGAPLPGRADGADALHQHPAAVEGDAVVHGREREALVVGGERHGLE